MVRLALPSHRVTPISSNPTLVTGTRYERRVTKWLAHEVGMVAQVEFERDGYGRFIPDGLIFSPDFRRLVVVEIKTQHSYQGVAQLRNYQRWLRDWFNGPVSALEVCGTYHHCSGPRPLMVTDPLAAFHYDYAVMPMNARWLPKVRDGLGKRNTCNPGGDVQPGGDSNHRLSGIERNLALDALSGTEFPRRDSATHG